MTGIYDCFGYGEGYDVTFSERYRLIKAAGFDCVMLWWSDRFGRGEGFEQDACLTKQAGLILENMHAPVHEQDLLSEDDLAGDHVFHDYLKCVEDCDKYDIPTVVIHLPDDRHPLSALGNARLDRLIDKAGELGVQIAFENLRNIHNLAMTLERVSYSHIGFCYDSCHHINYASDTDLLKAYGDRLKALHLHDNGGIHDQHQLPFDGRTDWAAVMNNIRSTGYSGAVTLEPMNWDHSHLDIRGFLKLAHERAERLELML